MSDLMFVVVCSFRQFTREKF